VFSFRFLAKSDEMILGRYAFRVRANQNADICRGHGSLPSVGCTDNYPKERLVLSTDITSAIIHILCRVYWRTVPLCWVVRCHMLAQGHQSVFEHSLMPRIRNLRIGDFFQVQLRYWWLHHGHNRLLYSLFRPLMFTITAVTRLITPQSFQPSEKP
jgi:hypothetical protein